MVVVDYWYVVYWCFRVIKLPTVPVNWKEQMVWVTGGPQGGGVWAGCAPHQRKFVEFSSNKCRLLCIFIAKKLLVAINLDRGGCLIDSPKDWRCNTHGSWKFSRVFTVQLPPLVKSPPGTTGKLRSLLLVRYVLLCLFSGWHLRR